MSVPPEFEDLERLVAFASRARRKRCPGARCQICDPERDRRAGSPNDGLSCDHGRHLTERDLAFAGRAL